MSLNFACDLQEEKELTQILPDFGLAFAAIAKPLN